MKQIESSDILSNEDPYYLTEQIITYLGNKRSLLSFIGTAVEEVKNNLHKEKLDIVDLFSGSGIVSRYFKQYSNNLYVNDLEDYCKRLNTCYLANKEDIDFDKLQKYYDDITSKLKESLHSGFITGLYSPKDDDNIQAGERVFYTSRNAKYIDTARQLIEEVPEPYKTYLLAPLLFEASVHVNTSGVFRGFYKNSSTGKGQFGGNGENALDRIKGNINLKLPIFSNFSCNVNIYQEDANKLVEELPEVDLIYLDPPYNQHPYGSNYFMLNLIDSYKKPIEISEVSGIPKDWNKSNYNKKNLAKNSLEDLCKKIKAKYILISFNNEGFISNKDMMDILSKIGEVKVFDINYVTFKGSRNLNNRNTHVTEYLYLVKVLDK